MTTATHRLDLEDPPVDSLREGPHQQALDGLRGIAILAVMLFHFTMSERASGTFGKVTLRLFSAGWAGVDLFFALSGFLITGILLDTKHDARFFRTFYARRALRIFPLYYAVLALAMLAIAVTFGARSEAARYLFQHQLWLWTYGTNIEDALAGHWVFNTKHLWLNHFWSLAVEEQFYLCWPLLVFALRRRSLALVSGLIVIAAPLVRAVLVARGTTPLTVYSLTVCRLDPLALGSLAALVARDPRLTSRVMPFLPPVVGACFVELGILAACRRGLDWLDPVVLVAALTPLAMLSSAAVFWASAQPRGPGGLMLRHPVLRWFGRYSYGLYVFHYLLWPLLLDVCSPERLAGWTHSAAVGAVVFVIVGVGASTLVAIASYHGFERHFLALKRYFPRRPGARLVAAS